MQEFYGIGNEMTLHGSYGFPGGIGHRQEVCGAVAGGVIALGLRIGEHIKDFQQAKDLTLRRAAELAQAFEKTFGHVDCLSLVGPVLQTEEAHQKWRASGRGEVTCKKYQEFVVETLARWEESGQL